jgi:cytidylate kinase
VDFFIDYSAYFSNKKINLDEIPKKINSEVSFKLNEELVSVLYKKKDITNKLRTEEIAKIASQMSAKNETRKSLFNIQRNFYTESGLVAGWTRYGNSCISRCKIKNILNCIF